MRVRQRSSLFTNPASVDVGGDTDFVVAADYHTTGAFFGEPTPPIETFGPSGLGFLVFVAIGLRQGVFERARAFVSFLSVKADRRQP